jgi:SpoVK/Ycf46/Vps4 family AAA+-type ATPase
LQQNDLTPLIIVFDEMDVMTHERTDKDATLQQLVHWFMSSMSSGFSNQLGMNSQVLVIGFTNDPYMIDMAVRRRFDTSLFLDLPDGNALISILKHYKFRVPEKILIEIYGLLGGARIDGASFVKALGSFSDSELRLDYEKVASLIYSRLTPNIIPDRQVREFNNRCYDLILQSKSAEKYWRDKS